MQPQGSGSKWPSGRLKPLPQKYSKLPPIRRDEAPYLFQSAPMPIPPSMTKKFREAAIPQPPESPAQYGNIMQDKRILRGNTYSLRQIPAPAQLEPIQVQRKQENRRRALARRRAKEQFQLRAPDPVEGRVHVAVQTELYLEELTDRVEEDDKICQTDAFLDRPPSPLFVPAKSGLDAETQIYENDLFDFDMEVKPILEVIVGKTIEQSLLEVMEEEELANLRKQQREFEELRNAELVEQQRLEEQERRHHEEKERRMQQQKVARKMEKELREKIAAKAFAQRYLASLMPAVFGTLTQHGYFYDETERAIEVYFMEWLMNKTEHILDKQELGQKVMDNILREVVSQRHEAFQRLDQALMDGTFRRASSVEREVTAANLGSAAALQGEDGDEKGEGEDNHSHENADESPDTDDAKTGAGGEDDGAVGDD